MRIAYSVNVLKNKRKNDNLKNRTVISGPLLSNCLYEKQKIYSKELYSEKRYIPLLQVYSFRLIDLSSIFVLSNKVQKVNMVSSLSLNTISKKVFGSLIYIIYSFLVYLTITGQSQVLRKFVCETDKHIRFQTFSEYQKRLNSNLKTERESTNRKIHRCRIMPQLVGLTC